MENNQNNYFLIQVIVLIKYEGDFSHTHKWRHGDSNMRPLISKSMIFPIELEPIKKKKTKIIKANKSTRT